MTGERFSPQTRDEGKGTHRTSASGEEFHIEPSYARSHFQMLGKALDDGRLPEGTMQAAIREAMRLGLSKKPNGEPKYSERVVLRALEFLRKCRETDVKIQAELARIEAGDADGGGGTTVAVQVNVSNGQPNAEVAERIADIRAGIKRRRRIENAVSDQ